MPSTELSITRSRNSLSVELDGSLALERNVPEVHSTASSSCSTELKLTLIVNRLATLRAHVQVDPARIDAVRKATQHALAAIAIQVGDQVREAQGRQLGLGVADDFARARVGEQDLRAAIDHDHAVGSAFEEVCVAPK